MPLLFENPRPKLASSSALLLEVKPVCSVQRRTRILKKWMQRKELQYTFQPMNIIDDADQTFWICRLILHTIKFFLMTWLLICMIHLHI